MLFLRLLLTSHEKSSKISLKKEALSDLFVVMFQTIVRRSKLGAGAIGQQVEQLTCTQSTNDQSIEPHMVS